MNQNHKSQSLIRSLGFKEALSLVIGSVIGTGIFLKTAVMSQQVGSPLWVLVAFAAAGVLSFCGALCYAELGSRFSQAGGEYVFLKEAYGDRMAFLYGWMRFWIGGPGSIAAYAVGTATFVSGLINLEPSARVMVALVVIWIFTAANCLSVVLGGKLQTFLTGLKIFMIIGLTFSLFTMGSEGSFSHLSVEGGSQWMGWSAFGTAMIAALWAYDGWNNMPMVAGEITEPQKNIPRALAMGLLLIFGIYLTSNLSYFYALPFAEVTSAYSKSTPLALPVATKAAQMAIGPIAVIILSIAFIISAVGAMNGSILTNARVPFAMARDRLFFSRLGDVTAKHRIPMVSILVQAVIASVLAMSGTFDQLTDYVVFSAWIFYALATGGIFILRKKADNKAGYRIPLYPWLPIVFIICSLLLLANTIATSTKESGIGLVLILSGLPFYEWFKRSTKKAV